MPHDTHLPPQDSPPASDGAAAAPGDVDPRLARLPQLFRDSREAGEVHPLEHLMRRYFNGDRA
jgi:hypothetical protein